MEKPYIFGHRGAMGYEIENTIKSFERAVSMGAGIETDLHLTKDNQLVCIHDGTFEKNSNIYDISELTIQQLNMLDFEDDRRIPLLESVFNKFKEGNSKIRYSFDIGDHIVGMELINLAIIHELLDSIEITDTRINILAKLREYNNDIKLVHTLPHNIPLIKPETLDFNVILENQIHAINLKAERTNIDSNMTQIIDNGLKCYVWGVNSKNRMKKLLRWRYKDEFIEAIYTNYPDVMMAYLKKYF
ncbi:MAG: hypothetical protein JW891_18885 [Candidatus Lokiarchaeota archaeon]|nr:hypothetical protein [Candidatus Lokiarchaeota archaeon]